MSRDDALRRLGEEVAQARADARYLLDRVRETSKVALSSARRSADDQRNREHRRVREAFRKELEAVRNDIHGLSSGAGLALSPWSDGAWNSLDADATDPTKAGGIALRLGEITCFPDATSEDTLRVPATLVPDRTGAVLLNAKRSTLDHVRGALLGWCVRLLAHAGPGAVSIVWIDEGTTELPIPDAWRPAGGEPPVIENYHRDALSRAGSSTGHVAPAFGADTASAVAVRTVLVAIGPDADRVTDLGPWLTQCAAASRHRVHVLVAPTRPPRGVGGDVVVLDRSDHRGRMCASDAALGRHEVILQDAPSADVVRLVAPWAVPFGAVRDAADTHAATQAPAEAGSAKGAGASSDASASTSIGFGVAYLRQVLDAPTPDPPQLTIALDARGVPIRVPLRGPVLATGVDLSTAAAMVATHLVEVACQASANELEFTVLDTSDDPIVADRIDAVVDHVPHLVDFSQGIGALVTCDAILDRIAHASRGEATLVLFVIATSTLPERWMTPLARILQTGAKARVLTCVWAPDDAVTAHAGPDATRLHIRDTSTTLHVGGEPGIEVTVPRPLEPSDVEAVTDVLRRVRS